MGEFGVLSLRQLRIFLTTYELGSLTAAAEELGYAQPSISEQVRLLERSLGVSLFHRVGRGVVPTEAGEELRTHAERTLRAADDAERAVRAVHELESGTVRFGLFGGARLYFGAQIVVDLLELHPGVRVEIIGQNSIEVMDRLRRGRIEAALIASDVVGDDLAVVPVARDEIVYASADPEHTRTPVTASRLVDAELALSETTWRATDATRQTLRQMIRGEGRNPQARIEVEDMEIAVELMGRGLADTVLSRGVADRLLPRLAPNATWVSLRPKQYQTFSIVHRRGAHPSPAARVMIELATRRIQEIAEPITKR